MINDSVLISGSLSVVLFDENNLEKDRRDIKNMVVGSGKNLIAALIAGSTAKPTHVALGSGTLAPNESNTTLGSETAGTRRVFNSSNSLADVATFITTWLPGVSTGTYSEAGIFNASSAGTMLARTAFSPIIKTAGDKLVITWNIRVN